MKTTFRKLVAAAAIAMIGLSPVTRADDIDLYTGGESATGAETNVLIVLDNSANWNAQNQGWTDGSAQGQAELQALSEIASTLGDNVNVGLLMASGAGGGYLRYSIRSMTDTNKSKFTAMLNQAATDFDVAADRGSYWQVASSATVYENMLNHAYRYFGGLKRLTNDGPSGSDPDMRDYNGNNNSATRQPGFPNALGGYSLPVLPHTASTLYLPPSTVTSGCAKNYIIFIGNGYPSQFGTKADLTAAATEAGVTADITDVSGGDNGAAADEWTRFMYKVGVKSTVDDPKSTTTPKAKLYNKISTYTIDVCKNGCTVGSGPNQSALLKSMAKVGGGKYFLSTSKAAIKNALALIFAEIQAVNSVFASATLPISVNTQGTYENQVYIGVFRPDGGSRPRWMGNLKEYKFGRYCDKDRNDKVAIDNTRALVNGMIPATLTGTATGAVTGTFSGSVTNAAGTTTSVSGTVTGTISGTASGTLAATFGSSAGTSNSPAADLGSGVVTGTISGTGGTSTFTGRLYATPSLTGTYTSTDERIGDDVPAPDCGTDSTGKIPLKLYMGDKNGYRAIDEEGNTGFIDLSAKSFWTSDSTFWAFQPSLAGSSSDNPDGPTVERGGAAQRLRQIWTNTGTPDGRKIYTCLSGCLGAAQGNTLRNLTDSSNAFTTSNSAVTTALAAPSGSTGVTLSRSGTTVTATVTSGTHSFVDGNSVVIAGVTGAGTDGSGTVTDYNGTKTVTTGGSTTSFTYTITETPATSVTGASATFGSGTTSRTITSIALSGTGCTSGACKPGSAVTATMVASGTLTSPVAISGVVGTMSVAGSPAQATNFLDSSSAAVTLSSGTTYTYSVTLPAAPGAATGATATNGTTSQTGMTVAFDAANNRFTLTCGTCSGSNKQALNALASGATVVVSGASDAKYNGTWTLASNATNTTLTLTYRTYSGCSSNCGGGTATYGSTATDNNVSITRASGATTATVTTSSFGFSTPTNCLANGSTVSVTATGYTGSYTVSGVTHSSGGCNSTGTTSFTISPITTGPAAAAGTITATLSGAGSGPTTNNLITWTRGKDLWEDENLNSSLTDVRASIHGDVLHSRPVVVNYGSTIGIVAFYGSNDGFLRSVHGGIGGDDGEEKWAFIPTEFVNYTKLARLYSNSENIRFPNTQCTISPNPTARNYMWDGVLTAWQSSDGTATTAPTKTWLFASMRRGGRALYALDVSNPDTPKVMWRITNASTGFSELGQTWSEPKVTKLKGTFTRADATVVTNPVVLIFGAGYDAAQEDKPEGSVVTPTMGRGVYVVDAETGQLIKFLDPSGFATGYRSFPADVNVLDLNSDGYADRIYAVDTNANIFRFDTVQTVTDVTSSTYWKRYHVARLGDTGNDGGNDSRKFMFQPEVLPYTQSGVVKVMVLVGSGNREKPLGNFNTDGSLKTLTCPARYSDNYFATSTSGKIRNRFYGVIDTIQSGDAEGSNTIILESVLQQVNANDGTLTPFTISGTGKGWYIQLRNDPDGNGARNEEKTVNAARVVAGVVFFSTNTPVNPDTSAGICSNLGEALGYAVDPFTGMPAFNRDSSTDSSGAATYTAVDYGSKFSGGGLPPTVTAGVVTIGGTPYRFIIGSGSETLTSASSIAGARSVVQLTGTRTRLYWSYGADD